MPGGNLLLEYQAETAQISKRPEAATEPLPPEEIESADGRYITGLHREQYRHATLAPEPCCQSGLRRDCGEARVNNAKGPWALRPGEPARAESSFRTAIALLPQHNPYWRYREPYQYLGRALAYGGRLNSAHAAFRQRISRLRIANAVRINTRA